MRRHCNGRGMYGHAIGRWILIHTVDAATSNEGLHGWSSRLLDSHCERESTREQQQKVRWNCMKETAMTSHQPRASSIALIQSHSPCNNNEGCRTAEAVFSTHTVRENQENGGIKRDGTAMEETRNRSRAGQLLALCLVTQSMHQQ